MNVNMALWYWTQTVFLRWNNYLRYQLHCAGVFSWILLMIVHTESSMFIGVLHQDCIYMFQSEATFTDKDWLNQHWDYDRDT